METCKEKKAENAAEKAGAELYKDKTRTPRERAVDLLGRLTLTEKVGQLNQRLYGFRVCTRTETAAGQADESSQSDRESSQFDSEEASVQKDVQDGCGSEDSSTQKDARDGCGSEVSPVQKDAQVGFGLALSEEFCRETERFGGLGVLYGLHRADPWSGRDYGNGLTGVRGVQAYDLVQQYVTGRSRFGIPALLSSESPHGHQALDSYLLPVNLAVGATWNPALAKRAARVCARQLRGLGIDLALVSMLDVLRDPRWGRCEECFGEDPYLAAQFAGAVTEGYREEGVGVVAKHFAAQGETTGGVNASSARIGERELREIHLPPAEAAVKAGAVGVMAAYNDIDGIPCHNNPWLLGDVLRGEMGFDGIVMADGVAVDRLGFLYGTPAECGAAALASGVDVSLWDEGFAHLEEAVSSGLVSEERLDEAVLRVLQLKFERGLFETPYLDAAGNRSAVMPEEWNGADRGSAESEKCANAQEKQADGSAAGAGEPENEADQKEMSARSARLCQENLRDAPENMELALESVVLLKNEGEVLPLGGRPEKKAGNAEKACCEREESDSIRARRPGEETGSIEACRPGEEDAGDTQGHLRVALIGETIRDVYALLGDYTPPVRPESAWTVERGFRETFAQRTDLELIVCDRAEQTADCDVTVLVLGGSSSRFGGAKFDVNGAAVAEAKTAEKSERANGENAGKSLDDAGVAEGMRADGERTGASGEAVKPERAQTRMDCGEGVDLSSLQLPQSQLALARRVFDVSKRTVTVVVGGRPYEIRELAERSDALLYSFYPGPKGGLALAQLVTGVQSPSGRLPVSLPRSAGQLPVWYNARVSYEAMHYCDEEDDALYPFGFGLGYGEAQYAELRVDGRKKMQNSECKNAAYEHSDAENENAAYEHPDAENENAAYEHSDAENENAAYGNLNVENEGDVTVSFTVSNPTTQEVFAVPMVFIRHKGGSIPPRRAELKAFAKYRLAPGETRRERFVLPRDAFAVWNSRMQRCVEPGEAVVTVQDGGRILCHSQLRLL